jgi:cytosine deaminase
MISPEIIRIGLDAAIAEAEAGWEQGGIPIGSALLDDQARVVASGHNMRVQSGDPTAHAEVSCIRNAGRRRDWRTLTLVSTLSPCSMCSGTSILFKIPRVVIGENRTFMGAEEWMRKEGIELLVVDDARCIALMEIFQREKPDLWAEDIGE